MPFTSQSQMSTCFSKQIIAKSKGKKWSWNCETWLSETPDPACLPYKKGGHPRAKCRKLKPNEKIISPIFKGSRGGHYFYAANVKVYIPKGDENLKYAKKMYGSAN